MTKFINKALYSTALTAGAVSSSHSPLFSVRTSSIKGALLPVSYSICSKRFFILREMNTDKHFCYKVQSTYYMSYNEFKVCGSSFHKALLSELNNVFLYILVISFEAREYWSGSFSLENFTWNHYDKLVFSSILT